MAESKKLVDYITSVVPDDHIVYVTVSGSHLYGFESPDSDIDYRGCFRNPTIHYFGLKKPKDEINIQKDNNDVVLFELEKELGLIVKGNCNVLEHIFAEPLITSKLHDRLRLLCGIPNAKGIIDSYHGMAMFNYNKYIRANIEPLVKKYLYVFRALLAGIYFMKNQKIESNIVRLATLENLREVLEAVEMKKLGQEKVTTSKNREWDLLIDGLFSRYDDMRKFFLDTFPVNEEKDLLYLQADQLLHDSRMGDII